MASEPMRLVEGVLGCLILLLALAPSTSGFTSSRLLNAPAGLVPHAPIRIDGDAAFNTSNGVTAGSGTAQDPYIIEGWYVAPEFTNPILIANTRSHFVLRNTSVQSGPLNVGAVTFLAVSNATVQNLTLGEPAYERSLYMEWAHSVSIQDSYFGPVVGSVRIEDSSNISLTGNAIANGLEVTRTVGLTMFRNTMDANGLFLDGSTPEQFDSHVIASDNRVNGLPIMYYSRCNGLVIDAIALAQLIVASCRSVTVSNLTTLSLRVAIRLAFVQSASVAHNKVANSSYIGIAITNGTDAIVRENLIREGRGVGLGLVESRGIRVGANDFLRNAVQAQDAGGMKNSWNASYPEGGNYWSTYDRVDRCHGLNQSICTAPDGFGDVPYPIDTNAMDHYPREGPATFVDEPPIAVFTQLSVPLYAEEWSLFDPQASHDPDGHIVEFRWDWGEGTVTSPDPRGYLWFGRSGSFNVTLTVVHDVGQKGRAYATVYVYPKRYPPSAVISPFPAVVETIDAVHFDGSNSSSDGSITSYEWIFGDGTNASGVDAFHTYRTPGTYYVELTVRNNRSLAASAVQQIRVLARTELVMYAHAAGFRLLIPVGWDRNENQSYRGSVVELEAIGPDWEGFRSNLIVDTALDSTIRESPTFLRGLADGIVAGLSQSAPDLVVVSAANMSSISGHAAVFLAVRYPSTDIVQWIGIVVSEAHGRYWLIVLTFRTALAATMGRVFASSWSGFEITLAPPLSPNIVLVIVGGSVGAGAASVLVLAIVLHRRGRNRSSVLPPLPMPVETRSPQAEGRLCPACGNVGQGRDRFCSRCGRDLPGDRALPTTGPLGRPPSLG